MKRLFAVIVAIVSVGCATAPPTGELQPRDFAYGQAFEASFNAPFVRVALPDAAFTQTAWPDLRDVRVYNAAGEAVPFARLRPAPTTSAPKRIALRSFRLAQENPGGLPRVELDAGVRGVQMRVVPNSTPERGAEYVLATTEDDATARIERLILNWEDAGRNWQQNVTVSFSQDLQGWTPLVYRRPIMDLRTGDGERLTFREVAVDASAGYSRPWQASGYAARYWRLQFEPGFTPALISVEAELLPEVILPPGVDLPMNIVPQSDQNDGSVVYSIPGVHPISHLRFALADVNTVVPVLVEGRRNVKDKWQFVAAAVVYRINTNNGEQVSEPIRVGGGEFSSFRVKPFGTTFGSKPPSATAIRDALVLVVNARGAGPFLLAWGSRAASDASIDASLLMPNGTKEIAGLPDARMGASQDLGGPARLTELAPAERAARWQTVLVWVALIGGAGALGALALRLLRESRAQA